MDSIKLQERLYDVPIFQGYVLLVLEHFRDMHKVSDYAALLHKSPKTLVNTFTKLELPKPLEIIHGKLIMESIRLIMDSDKPINELAAEIGYFDLDSFSRCFKKKTGFAPRDYRHAFEDYNVDRVKEIVSADIYVLLTNQSTQKGLQQPDAALTP